MPIVDHQLMYVLNAAGDPVPLQVGAVSFNVDVDGTVYVTPAGYIDRYAATQVCYAGAKASSGDNQVIANPGTGHQIAITSLMVQNESATATTMIIKAGSTTLLRCLGQNQGDGAMWTFPVGRELVLGVNQPLILNLSGANSCGISVVYYVIPV